MPKQKLTSNVNVRLCLSDMNLLREKAEKLRVPTSTLCRTIIIKDLEYEAPYKIS